MIIKTKNTSYECLRAERHNSNIHLYDEDQRVIILDDPVITEVVDGEIVIIEAEEPTQLDRIESQVTYTAIMTDTLQEVF